MDPELQKFILTLRDQGEGPLAIAEAVEDLYGIIVEDPKALYNEATGYKEPESRDGDALSQFKESYIEETYELLLLGKSLKDLADYFNTDIYTVNTWRDEIPEFADCWTRAVEADRRVAKSLLKLALGYEQEDVKVFQFRGEAVYVPYVKKYQPDLSAQRLWLQSKHPVVWKETQVLEQKISHSVEDMTDEELEEQLMRYGVSQVKSPLSNLEKV